MDIVDYHPDHLYALRKLYLDVRRQTFTWLDTHQYQLSDFDRDTLDEQIYVALWHGQVVGFISIWQPDHFIHHLYVDSQYHHLGLGKNLLAKARSEHATLSLKCMTQNVKAARFYAAQGFKIISHHQSDEGGYQLMRYGAKE